MFRDTMDRDSQTGRGRQQQQRPRVQLTPRPLPSQILTDLLFAPQRTRIRFVKSKSQFWYQPDVTHDAWKRIYGLTSILRHVFWPDYDRDDPVIADNIQRLKQTYYNQRKRQRKKLMKASAAPRSSRNTKGRRRARSVGSGGATKTTAQILAESEQPRAETEFGTHLGELVHRQLHVWAMDRFYGTRLFGRVNHVKWPADPRTVALQQTIQQLGIDVRYGELMVFDPRVPVATSIDLVGWSPRLQRVVLIEIKTGSKWNRQLGNAPMRGRAPRVLQFNNAPLHQALVQLATTAAVVQEVYRIDKLQALLLWTTRWPVPVQQEVEGTAVHGEKVVQVDKYWLSDKLARAGRIMLREMQHHLQARGGRAWAKPTKNTRTTKH
jgi:hypothetical protein